MSLPVFVQDLILFLMLTVTMFTGKHEKPIDSKPELK